MEQKSQGLFRSVLGFLCIPFGILFLFGLILNYDDVSILMDRDEYREGVLKADSVYAQSLKRSHESLIYFYGHADSVFTVVLVGETGTPYTDSIFNKFYEKKTVEVPVWYKSNGDLSLPRKPNDNQFPIDGYIEKLIEHFLFFNAPFIVVIVWYQYLKRRRKNEL